MLVKLLVSIITIYRKFLSPFFGFQCRFEPTCSQYAVEALKTHGAFKGLILSVKRVLRCNPFFPGGYDPPPRR